MHSVFATFLGHSESFWYDVNLRSCPLLQVKQLCPANARPHTTHSQTRPLGGMGHGMWALSAGMDGMWCGIFLDHAMQVQRMPENGYPDALPHTNIQSRSFWRFLFCEITAENPLAMGHLKMYEGWYWNSLLILNQISLTTKLTVNLIFFGEGDAFGFVFFHLYCYNSSTITSILSIDSSGKHTYR